MLTDVMEEKLFNNKTYVTAELGTAFEEIQERMKQNQDKPAFIQCMEIAMSRFMLKKIASYITDKTQFS